MYSKRTKYFLPVLVLSLLIIDGYLLYIDWSDSNKALTLAILNVGQGDALFIESPTGAQVLVDAGPPRKILSELLKVMPPLDKSIDVAILTHPDQDHIGGFLDVLRKYDVGVVLESGGRSDTRTHQNLQAEIGNKKIPKLLAKKGMRIHMGGGAIVDVLFPDRDVSLWDTNDGSIVAKLTYGETSVMLTGDATSKTEEIILKSFTKESLDSDILKVGHHGSRFSSSSEFVDTVSPVYALISVGANNSYGHPHPDVLSTLSRVGAKIFQTDTQGTIIMQSDGQDVSFSFKK